MIEANQEMQEYTEAVWSESGQGELEFLKCTDRVWEDQAWECKDAWSSWGVQSKSLSARVGSRL